MFRVINLNKKYKNKNKREKHALKDVSFSTTEKGMFFIVGENGSGKSTLIKLLSSQEHLDSGLIEYKNKDLKSFSSREKNYFLSREISIVNQDLHMFFDLTVEECLELSHKIIDMNFDKNKLIGDLKLVNLEEHMESNVSDLSVGERQRLIILLSLIKKPKVIFLDEPTSALDYKNSKKIFDTLKKISETTLIIIACHNYDLVDQYADFKLLIKNGMVNEGNRDIFNNKDKYNADIKQKGLKNIDILRFAFKTFKKRGFKLYLYTILTIIFSFAYLLLMYSTNFSFEKASKQYFKNTGNNYITVLSKEDDPVFPNKIPIYNYELNYETTNNIINDYYTRKTDYVGIVNEYNKASLNYNLVSGSLPNSISEILITDYHYNVFNDLGINGNQANKYNSYDDLIGETIVLNNETYDISGILSTGINNELYKNISDEPLRKHSILNYELINLMSNDILNVVFFSEEKLIGDKDISFWLVFAETNKEKSNLIHQIIQSENLDFLGVVGAHYKYSVYSFEFLYKYKNIFQVFLYFLIFAIFLLFSTEIMILRKKDMVLLRNYGVKKSDIWKIYVAEGLLFSLFIVAVIVILFLITTVFIEIFLSHFYSYSLIGYSLNVSMFLNLIIIGLLSSFITNTLYYIYLRL